MILQQRVLFAAGLVAVLLAVVVSPAFAGTVNQGQPNQKRSAASPSSAKPISAKEIAKAIKQTVARINKTPLVAYVAKGPADSCGPGCDTWIAVEGSIDEKSADRFIKFFASTKKDLPVFFHSPGGLLEQALRIGEAMRSRRTRVGVGLTYLSECTAQSSPQCMAIKRSGREIKAQLLPNGECMSACSFVILGGVRREIPREASIRVHSSQHFHDRPKAYQKRSLERVGAYMTKSGVSADLMKLILSVPFERLRTLTRDEIFRFHIDTRPWDTNPWVAEPLRTGSIFATRVLRKGWGGGDTVSSLLVQVSCFPRRAIELQYTATGPNGSRWPKGDVVVNFDGAVIRLPPPADASGIQDNRTVAIPRDLIGTMMAARAVSIAEVGPAGELRLETPVDTRGFAVMMKETLVRCPAAATG
jgi:hypothetical protein